MGLRTFLNGKVLVTLAPDLYDMCMMQEPVQHGGHQRLISLPPSTSSYCPKGSFDVVMTEPAS